MSPEFISGEAIAPVDALFFGPHPDDIELFAGGLLAHLVRQDHPCGIVDLSFGELGSFGTPEIRRSEAKTASGILGASFRLNMGLPDGQLSLLVPEVEKTAINELVRIIRTARPEFVVFPFSVDRHPDHGAASRLIESAVSFSAMKNFSPQLGAPHQVRQSAAYPIRVATPVSFIVDISHVYETKQKAIRAFSSQVTPAASHSAPGIMPLIGSSLSLSSLEARDASTGALIGSRYGEAFCTRNAVPISDPVKHFREHLLHPPLYYLR